MGIQNPGSVKSALALIAVPTSAGSSGAVMANTRWSGIVHRYHDEASGALGARLAYTGVLRALDLDPECDLSFGAAYNYVGNLSPVTTIAS